jgi:hypothetical protein
MKLLKLFHLSLLAMSLGVFACGGPDEGELDQDLGESSSALKSGGGGGLGFECDRATNTCSCTGPITSQDCLDMADNCSDEIHCGIFVENCICPMWPARTSPTPTVAPLPGGIGGYRK